MTELNIKGIIEKVENLNKRATDLNAQNQKEKVEKDYAEKDLIKTLNVLKEKVPNLDLDFNDPDFETKLQNFTNEVVKDIQAKSEHMEKVIVAQENDDIATLESVLGITIGRKTIAEEVKLERVSDENAENIALPTNTEQNTKEAEQTTQEETVVEKEETVNSNPLQGLGGLGGTQQTTGGLSGLGSTQTEVKTEETVTSQEETTQADIEDVKGLFSTAMAGGISATNEPVSEEPKEEPTQQEPTQQETVNKPVSTGLDFGSYFTSGK